MQIQERPAQYKGPNLDSTGVRLYPRFLGKGTYALMASRLPRDNSGVIIGWRGALVIDSCMNGAAHPRPRQGTYRQAHSLFGEHQLPR